MEERKAVLNLLESQKRITESKQMTGRRVGGLRSQEAGCEEMCIEEGKATQGEEKNQE